MHPIERPETQYVMSGDVSVAFQVFGKGQQDLLYVPGIISHLETNWDEPNSAKFLNKWQRLTYCLALETTKMLVWWQMAPAVDIKSWMGQIERLFMSPCCWPNIYRIKLLFI